MEEGKEMVTDFSLGLKKTPFPTTSTHSEACGAKSSTVIALPLSAVRQEEQKENNLMTSTT